MYISSLIEKNLSKGLIQVKIIDKKEFVKVALNKYVEVFIMHMTFLSTMAINLAK